MDLDGLDPLARIVFAGHVGLRWTERFGGILDESAARGEIRAAIVEGRLSGRRPAFAQSSSVRRPGRADDPDGAVFLWPVGESRCWVAQPLAEGGLFIRTVLAATPDLDARRLRPGLVRR